MMPPLKELLSLFFVLNHLQLLNIFYLNLILIFIIRLLLFAIQSRGKPTTHIERPTILADTQEEISGSFRFVLFFVSRVFMFTSYFRRRTNCHKIAQNSFVFRDPNRCTTRIIDHMNNSLLCEIYLLSFIQMANHPNDNRRMHSNTTCTHSLKTKKEQKKILNN